MTQSELELPVRKWCFYIENNLAYAAVTTGGKPPEIGVRCMETTLVPNLISLPERMGLEQVIRERVSADIKQVMGQEWVPAFRFEPRRVNEHWLAQTFFGIPDARPFSDKQN